MTRQDEFRAELFDLLRRYKVEMDFAVDYGGFPKGINFWSSQQFDNEGKVIAEGIDLTVGRWEDGQE